MKITRTFASGCVWCNAKGFITNPISGAVTDLTITCPVCNGSKTVIVTEEYDDFSERIYIPIKEDVI